MPVVVGMPMVMSVGMPMVMGVGMRGEGRRGTASARRSWHVPVTIQRRDRDLATAGLGAGVVVGGRHG
jgi:hypothetical protein